MGVLELLHVDLQTSFICTARPFDSCWWPQEQRGPLLHHRALRRFSQGVTGGMVYARSWTTFAKEARDAVQGNPNKTRFVTKWSAARGLLVLKVTNDRQCVKFQSRSAIILNRFELLTTELQEMMHARRPKAGHALFGAPAASIPSSAPVLQDMGAGGKEGQGPQDSGKPASKNKKKGGKKRSEGGGLACVQAVDLCTVPLSCAMY